MRSLALFTLVAAPSLAFGQLPSEAAPELRPRWMPTKSLAYSRGIVGDPHRLVLKVQDDFGARAEGGRLVPGLRPLPLLEAMLGAYGTVRVEPLVSTPPSVVHELRARGQARSGQALADLTQYFRLTVPSDQDADELMRGLLALDSVENAYVEPEYEVMGDVGAPTPDFSGSQNYHDAAPLGISLSAAGGYLQGYGAGQTVVDIELNWHIGHEDLSQLSTADLIGGTPALTSYREQSHGTATAGVLCADRDAVGVTGIVPDAELKVASIFTTDGAASYVSAVLDSTALLEPGDVLVIPLGLRGPNWDPMTGDFGKLSALYSDADFNAVQVATANGIHVAVSASNGSQNLDSTTPPEGHPTYAERFDLSVRDSGAIMVGASTGVLPHPRASFSNYGSRVDAFSWGLNVATTGYGLGQFELGDPFLDPCSLFPSESADPNQWYTGCYNGTSSATPIVGGAMSSINAMNKAAHGVSLGVANMRGLLRTLGTPSADGSISNQPDLSTQLARVTAGAGFLVYRLPDDVLENLFPIQYPDVDGDGVNDYLVGEYELEFDTGGGSNGSGSMRMFNGKTGQEMAVYEGLGQGDGFGSFLLRSADFDGDGFPEVLVGAPGLGGGAGGVQLLSPISGEVLWSYLSDKDGERLGAAALQVDDVDGDQKPDFVVSAPAGDDGESRIVVLSGADGSEKFQISGGTSGARFGTALALVDDQDDDGKPDLAVGAPGAQQGVGEIAIIGLGSQQVLKLFSGPEQGARFGQSIVASPLLGENGATDLLVGAPGLGAGSVRLVSSTDGDLGDFLPGNDGVEETLGWSLALTRDHDGDDLPDLLVGAPDSNAITINADLIDQAGLVHLVSTASGEVLDTWHGSLPGNRFGVVVQGGLAEGETPGEILVGAGSGEGDLADRGAAYIYAKGVPQPEPPSVVPILTGISPNAVEPFVPDQPTWLELTGTGLGSPLRVTVDGVQVPSSEIEVVDDTLVRVALPLIESLGPVAVEFESFGGSATEAITVNPLGSPSIDARAIQQDLLLDGQPGDLVQNEDGVIIIIGSTPGDVGFLLLSLSDVPTVLPGLFTLEIGNSLQSLFSIGTTLIPAKGWERFEFPELPDQDQPYDLFFEAVFIDPLTLEYPLADSNAQRVTVN